jgi:hypothetical protein
MWIIPKTLSAFVPDTEGLSLDLEERAWILESSAMWRSKPSSKPTWLRRLKKGGWMTHLSTRILKPSLHQSFEEKFVDSLVATPANRSVAQGSEKAKMTQDTYGHISESTSGQLDLFGAFSKMSEVTPRWGYGESCPIWKKMVTERSMACSARRKQARLTNASDASSLRGWATPQASDHVEGARTAKESNQKCLGRDLNQMENWPTPRAGNPGSRKPGTGGKILAEEAKKHNGPPAPEKSNTSGKNQGSWPTPRVGGHEKAETSIKRGRGVSLTGAVAKDATQTPKLNPNWVEQLMGLSTGWTDLGSWGMESCRKPQN